MWVARLWETFYLILLLIKAVEFECKVRWITNRNWKEWREFITALLRQKDVLFKFKGLKRTLCTTHSSTHSNQATQVQTSIHYYAEEVEKQKLCKRKLLFLKFFIFLNFKQFIEKLMETEQKMHEKFCFPSIKFFLAVAALNVNQLLVIF